MKAAIRRAAALAAFALAAFAAWVAWANRERPLVPSPGPVAGAQPQVERGAYLARAGNCAGCHTARGGAAYAGGRSIDTPFGSVVAGNLTPDATGLAGWSADDFWRALHEGRSRDGRLLNPAFPYTAFTLVTRADSDALFAYLRSLAPVQRRNAPHALRWPYGQPWAIAAWRALYFRPQAFEPDPARDAAWNRGAYLVRGLGHCAGCHAPRSALGGTLAEADLEGGLMPVSGWHAPALGGAGEAADLVPLLRSGQSARGSALGPMAEVVLHGTQHLSDEDLAAMARYLGSVPALPAPARATGRTADPALGARVYERHCAGCHGAQGDGQRLYPPLAGNRSVNLESPVNVVKAILLGGFAPSTRSNPRPFGMPPFGHVLDDAEIAAVASHVRTQWGNRAGPVSAVEVLRAR